MKKTLIFQTSKPRTCTTLLVNALYGLIENGDLVDKEIIYVDYYNKDVHENFFDDVIIVKSHYLELEDLVKQFSEYYNLFFICSERKDKDLLINDNYKLYENICIFQYEELNETLENTTDIIVETIHNKVNNLLNEKFNLNIKLNKENSINRINKMNKRYIEIKNESFNFVDRFYHLHGSHRINFFNK